MYVTGTYNGSKGSVPVGGGDGNYCDFSHANPTALFSSIYYGQVDRAATAAPFGGSGFDDAEFGSTSTANNGGPGASGFASFVTPIRLWENMGDYTSIDSVDFTAVSVKNNAAGTGNGGIKIFKSLITKTNNSAIFDSLYVSLGTTKVGLNYTLPSLSYPAVSNSSTGTITVTRREYQLTISGNSSTVTATSFAGVGVNDYDSLRISFSTAPTSGTGIKTELTQKYLSGADVKVTTKTTSGIKFAYNLPSNLASRATVRLPDIIQARLAVGITNKVYVVKKPLNFGITPDWVQVASSLSKDETNAATGFSGVVHTMAWSPDGDNLYVGTDNGWLYRISHLHGLIDSVGDKSSQPSVDAKFNGINTTGGIANPLSQIRCTRIAAFGTVITSISLSPDDGKRIIVTTGSYGSPKVYYAGNPVNHPSASGAGLFIDKMGVGANGLITNAPIYSSLIEYKLQILYLQLHASCFYIQLKMNKLVRS